MSRYFPKHYKECSVLTGEKVLCQLNVAQQRDIKRSCVVKFINTYGHLSISGGLQINEYSCIIKPNIKLNTKHIMNKVASI